MTFVKMIFITLNVKYVSTAVRVVVLAMMFGFDVVWCFLNDTKSASFLWFLVVDFVILWCVYQRRVCACAHSRSMLLFVCLY